LGHCEQREAAQDILVGPSERQGNRVKPVNDDKQAEYVQRLEHDQETKAVKPGMGSNKTRSNTHSL
jgi:hypothetical protein